MEIFQNIYRFCQTDEMPDRITLVQDMAGHFADRPCRDSEMDKGGILIKRRSKETLWGYLFILVPLAAFILFTLYPVVSALITSFQEYKPLGSTWIGLDNYITTFHNSLFFKALKNTVVYTVISVFLSVGFSFGISLAMMAFTKKFQIFFKAVFYLPAIASGVALSFVWKWIFDPLPTGLANRLAGLFGIPSQNWLGSSRTAMGCLITMAVFGGLGKNIIIYTAALLGIDSTYYEVAEMDGATFLQKIRYVVWALVKPTTVFLVITSVINSMQAFQQAYLMTGGGPDNATTMVGLLIFNRAFKYGDYGESCAEAIILTVIIGVLAFFQLKLSENEVEY